MSRYEVELDDETAQRFSRRDPFTEPTEIDAEAVSQTLAALIARYGGWPKVQTELEKAAMALARAKAMEHVAAMGATTDNVEWRAEQVLRFMLEGRG